MITQDQQEPCFRGSFEKYSKSGVIKYPPLCYCFYFLRVYKDQVKEYLATNCASMTDILDFSPLITGQRENVSVRRISKVTAVWANIWFSEYF